MTRFTDSPYEYMMSQKPHAERTQEKAPQAHATDNKCEGCAYGQGRRCVGICMKDLIASSKKRGITEHGTGI